MITLRPGSHMSNLLALLSVSCEFPTRSLHILGDSRTIRALIHKHKSPDHFKLYASDATLTTRLFQTSGTGRLKTLRLYKGALPLLNELHPDAWSYYFSASGGHRFSGGEQRIERQHRVSEAVAMCMMSGAEVRPYALPQLQKAELWRISLTGAAFYVARYLKTLCIEEFNQYKYTRIVGMLAYPDGAYAVYNTRDAVMKWRGKGERSAEKELSDLARWNLGVDSVDAAILIGNSIDVVMKTVIEAKTVRRAQERFESIYPHIHFVPLNQDGIKLLRILSFPDWKEKMLDAIFMSGTRLAGHSSVECDAKLEGVLAFSHLDGDIARLIRLYEAIKNDGHRFYIVCFPWQQEYLEPFFTDVSNLVRYLVFPMNDVMRAMGMEFEKEGS